MTTEFGSGLATGENGKTVGREAATTAVSGVLDGTVDFVLVFCSARYEYSEVLAGIQEVTGDAPLIGASTAGEFTDEQFEEGSVVVTVLRSDEMAFYTGLGEGLSEDIRGAVDSAASDIPELPDEYPHRVGINLHDGLVGRGEEVAMLSYQQFPIPFAGGSAGDDLALEETVVFRNDEVVTDGVALAIIASEKPLSLSVEHGHEPISEPLTATAVDGNVVTELNGRPAYDVYLEQVRAAAKDTYGIDTDTVDSTDPAFNQLLTFFQFGIDTGDGEYKVRWAGTTPDDSGPLRFATTIPEGTDLTVMHSPKQKQIESAREAARLAQDGLDGAAAGAVVFDCACRAAILQDEFSEAVDAMADQLSVPLSGFETYGEVCMREGEMRGYHNTTSSVLLIPE